jgi:hypothetical protein
LTRPPPPSPPTTRQKTVTLEIATKKIEFFSRGNCSVWSFNHESDAQMAIVL